MHQYTFRLTRHYSGGPKHGQEKSHTDYVILAPDIETAYIIADLHHRSAVASWEYTLLSEVVEL